MRTVASLIIAMFWVAGCSTPVVNSYRPGEPGRLFKVKEEGQYNLYAAHDKVPVVCPLLLKGERIGFMRNNDGSVVAIAGSNEWALPKRRYTWVRFGWGFPPGESPFTHTDPPPIRLAKRIARWFGK